MLELHFNDKDASTGSIPVSWCLDKKALDFISINKEIFSDPAIVIITTPNEGNHQEYRHIARISDLMTYVPLHFAGKNKIFAFIAPSYKMANKKFLDKYYDVNYDYIIELLDHYNENLDEDKLKYHLSSMRLSHPGFEKDDEKFLDIIIASSATITVPKDIFAKEPPAWERKWVNLLLGGSKATDQCSYRRQRIFAYTLQPIFLFIIYLLNFLWVGASLLYGSRSLINGLKSLIIFDFDYLSYGNYFDTSLFKDGTFFYGQSKNRNINILRLPFMPVFWILGYFIMTSCEFAFVFSMIFGIIVSMILLVALLSFKDIKDILSEKRNNIFLEETADLVICNGGMKPQSIDQLPSKHRTINLRFQQLKSKVCRPFSAV